LLTQIPTRHEVELELTSQGVEIEIEVEVEEVEELVWVYEHLRKIVVGLQGWVGVLQEECRAGGNEGGDCEEMRASEWLQVLHLVFFSLFPSPLVRSLTRRNNLNR
jgi:hypothetical protein